MERGPITFLPYFLPLLLSVGYLSAGTINEQSNRLSNLEQPLRLEHLDSFPLYLHGKSLPFPLLYPEEISVYKLIDHASSSFQTLEELSKLPVKNNFAKGHKKQSRRLVPIARSKGMSGVRNSNLSSEDPVQHFIQSSSARPLPTDAELHHFLKSGNHNSKDAKDAQSSKTFAEFKNEATSSLLSRIFKANSSARKRPELTNQNVLPPPPSNPGFDLPEAPALKLPEGDFSSTVKLRARKPTHNGQTEPAQASEFYLTTRNLQEILHSLDAGPAVAGELKTVAKIWAKAEKNASEAPEVALGVKSILLEAKVSKARTDPYGQAALRGVQPDEKYFLIGIDKDVQSNVVTIWSKEVDVGPGENLVELSSNDVIYQE